jgi:uncharacterized protein YndB with AHSA1/START domain
LSASERFFASGAEKAGRERDRVSVSHDLEIDVYYDAPREEVFENWIDATELRTWFAPYGFDVIECEVAAHPGGMWRVVFRSHDGTEFLESGEFREVVAPERLVFTLRHLEAAVTLETMVTVTFAVDGSGTRMTFRQTGFDTEAQRDDHRMGWGECFQQLKVNLVRTS